MADFPGRARVVGVAGQASLLAGLRLPVVTLRRLGVSTGMAHRAIAQVLREADLGVAVLAVAIAPNRIVLTAGCALEQLASVDFVNHGGEIQVVATVGIGGARVVAHHAELRIDAATTVQGQFLVAAIAGGHICHLAGLGGVRHGDRLAIGTDGEVEVRINLHISARCILVAQLNGDAMRQRGLEDHPIGLGDVLDVGLEGVGVIAVGVVNQLGRQQSGVCLLTVGCGLHGSSEHRRTGRPRADPSRRRLFAINVAHPLVRVAIGTGHQLGNGKAHVGNDQTGLDRAVRKHREIDLGRAVDSDNRYTGCLHHSEGRSGIDRRVVCRQCARRCDGAIDRG